MAENPASLPNVTRDNGARLAFQSPASAPSSRKQEKPLLGLGGFLRITLTYLRRYWKQSTLILLTLIPEIALEIIQPLLLMSLIDDAILPGNRGLVLLIVGSLLGLLLAYALAHMASLYLATRIAAGVTNELRLTVFERLQSLSVSFYRRRQAGDLLSRFTSDMDAVDRAYAIELPFGISCIFTIVLGSVVMLVIDWRLAVPILVLLPIVNLGPRWLEPRANKAGYLRQQDVAKVVTTVEEAIAAQPVVKAFGLQQLMHVKFKTALGELFRSTVRTGLLSSLQGTAMAAGGHVILVLTIGIGATLAVMGELSVGALVADFELVWFVVSSVDELGDVLPPLQRAAAGMQRIAELLDEQPEVLDAPEARPLPPFADQVALHEVSFSYNGGEPQLCRVSAMIPARSWVAIVGRSGSGKTTMLSLLMRFHDPSQGSITIDGHDLREITRESLRSQLGVVFQESFLFRTSVRENIRLGKPQSTDRDVEEAARAAEIHDFIMSLPDGYDTDVGEKGMCLSGGERQRISLARALIRRPAILILDEPASALDAQTEAAINATLTAVAKDRTVISVTHRLASVVNADRIFVLEKGRLAEQGRHKELLRREGVYYSLWHQQSEFLAGDNGQSVERQLISKP